MNKKMKDSALAAIAIITLATGVAFAVISSIKNNNQEEPTTEVVREIVTTETDEPTEIETTIIEEHTEETEEPSAVAATGIEVDPSTAKTMFTITNVNVRTGASLESPIITTLYTGKEIQVCEVGNPEWAVVILDGVYYYINKNFISETQPTIEEPTTVAASTPTSAPVSGPADKTGDFHYYGIWTGQYWHFTPEQIDNQWNGYKKGKPALAVGTTRAWQAYLYQKLSERGYSWWYKYACAQAMQESGFNPLADNGVDYGLFSFRLRYWDSSYGSVYDYRANINAYVDRISKYLIGVSTQNDIYMALSQHYMPDGQLHMGYVNAVLGRLNELWICD